MKNSLCVAAFAFTVLLLSSAAYADPQTGAAAPATATPAASSTMSDGNTAHSGHGPCHADIQSFCSNTPKGNGQVLTCLKAHVGQLSPRCEAAMKRHADQKTTPSAQPVSTPAPSTNGATPPK